MEPYLGQIVLFAGNFAPRGWAFCDGALMPIPQNSALFSLLGNAYGGDGRTTFALPDLRAATPAHVSEVDRVGATAGAATLATVGVARGRGTAAATAADRANVQPVLGLNYIIAIHGIYPPRP